MTSRTQKMRETRKAAGLTRSEVWHYPEQKSLVKAFEKQLQEQKP